MINFKPCLSGIAQKTVFNKPNKQMSTHKPSVNKLLYRDASHSSASWLQRQKNDVYVKKSRYDNYRARSAYKLIQIDDKYKFLKPGIVVIEAGAAPGSWTQVISERLNLANKDDNLSKKGMCLAIDIAAIQPVDGAICLGNADFTSPFTQAKILDWLNGRKADCVLSDMAPTATGQKYLNHTRIINLVTSLLPFTQEVLKPGGVFLAKLWDGNERQELVDKLEVSFERVCHVKPEASRTDSSELFLFCSGFKGRSKIK